MSPNSTTTKDATSDPSTSNDIPKFSLELSANEVETWAPENDNTAAPTGDTCPLPDNDDSIACVEHPRANPVGNEVPNAEVAAGLDSLPVPFSFAARISDTSYVSQITSWGDFLAQFCNPGTAPTIAHKDDAHVLCNALMDGTSALAVNIMQWGMIYSDHDDGQSMEESARIARERGDTRIILPTASYGTTEIEFTHDEYVLKAPGLGLPVEFTEQSGRDYLERRGLLIPEFAQSSKYLGRERVAGKGFVYRFETSPIPKHRTFGPVAEPITIGDYVKDGVASKTVIAAAADAYKAIHDERGGTYDQSCADLSHRLYRYSKVKGKKLPDPIYVKGKATDIKTPFLKALEARKSGKTSAKSGTRRKSGQRSSFNKSYIFNGFNLKAWIAQYKGYDIEGLMERKGRVLGDRPNGGKFVGCHDSHSGGIGETFCKNGEEAKGFILHCSGATGGCCDKDRLEHLMNYLADEIITIDDLKDESLGGGEISNRVIRDGARTRKPKTVVVDSEGWGLDAAKFIKAAAEQIDFAHLQTLVGDRKGVSVGPGMTAEDIVAHVNNGVFKVRDLLLSAIPEPDLDTYEGGLRSLVLMVSVTHMRQSAIDEAFNAIHSEHKVKLGSIKQDYKDEFRRLEEDCWALGKLSDAEAQALAGKYDYSWKFAIINTGGKAVVLNMHQPDLSKALHSHDDFVKLYRDDHILVESKQGVKPVYLADEWLKMPPEDVSFYRGGMVFKPPLDMSAGKYSNVAADTYNLWSGYLIEPDPSGSCRMFYRLLREVWCQGDEALTEWVKEWFWHILRHPGKKVTTSIGVNGAPGDGKSIVTEKMLMPILGTDMLLRVSNPKLVLGDFNEAITGKLVTVLEEAAFAGDKSMFAKLKEQVSGDIVVINPKNKAPITLDNFSRVITVSNSPHFMHIEDRDRRYCVLHTSSGWQGTTNFAAMMDEWENGGAARFLYDAMNHEFRRTEETGQLAISTKPVTEFEIEQRAESRELVDKFAIEFLLRGNFSVCEIRAPVSGMDFLAVDEVWKLDMPCEITLTALHDAFKVYLQNHAPRKVEHAPGMRAVLQALEKLCGEIEEKRETSGRRDRGPRLRVLPPRSEAVRYARENWQITAVEFDEAGLTDAEK